MIPEQNLPPSVAPLRNVAALQQLTDRLINRSRNLPGMATYYGPSGDGKSTAAIYVRQRLDAVLIQCVDTMTKADVCVAILREMGLPERGSIHARAERIAENLVITDRVLLIDEADVLFKNHKIELVRSLYEMSQAPVVLIGEERMPQKLRAYERIHNRQLEWVATQPAEMADVKQLARIYAPGVELDEGLCRKILSESHHVIRRVCTNLDRVREVASVEGVATMTLETWGDRSFFTGEAPAPRGAPAPRKGRVA